jgi:hypothetical protein
VLIIGDALPDDVEILPTVEALADCCSVAGNSKEGASYVKQAVAYVDGDIEKPPSSRDARYERVGTADFEEQWQDPEEKPF